MLVDGPVGYISSRLQHHNSVQIAYPHKVSADIVTPPQFRPGEFVITLVGQPTTPPFLQEELHANAAS
jgi:hypothetical protein